MKTRELTYERLKEKIHYDPDTGKFTRTCPDHNRKVGQLDKDGYLAIAIDRVGRCSIVTMHRILPGTRGTCNIFECPRIVPNGRGQQNPQALKKPRNLNGCGAFEWWRPRSESNRRRRICNPEHNHFATRPQRSDLAACASLSP